MVRAREGASEIVAKRKDPNNNCGSVRMCGRTKRVDSILYCYQLFGVCLVGVCVSSVVVVTLCASIIVPHCLAQSVYEKLRNGNYFLYTTCDCVLLLVPLFDSILMPRQMSDYYSDYVSPITNWLGLCARRFLICMVARLETLWHKAIENGSVLVFVVHILKEHARAARKKLL